MKKLFLLMLVVSVKAAGAQTIASAPAYFVYSLKGQATTQKSNAKPVQLKPNQLVYPSETLVIGNGAEVGLSNKNADYLVLNKAGAYKVNTLAGLDLFRVAVDNMTRQYLNLLYAELTGKGYSYDKLKKQSAKKSWGGVPRGTACNGLLYPVNGLKTAKDSLKFVWRSGSEGTNYILQILDEQKNELVSVQVKDTQYILPLKQLQQGEKARYFWRVVKQNGVCKDEMLYYFDFLSNEQEKAMVASLSPSFDHLETKEGLIAIAQLERSLLLDTAMELFERLVAAKPHDKVLKKSYAVFLLQYGFEEKAKTLMGDNLATK